VLSALAMIGAVTLVRVSGFLCTILGVNIPALLMLPYAILLGTLAICLWQISRGVAIEPAAIVSKWATAISARINEAATAR